ncbi:hypothetical protein PFICI_08614 [Pestalotiopsis fici W106-1]|uniref:DUF1763-domain-containing protein n=1 Tax=Pestalotiopsis fici (strain W106-1 / CGMCC3.15140) TaxID=1229662 RepID=W3X0U4_PESFW|nr:uncharacterized protein PFICI_08614 [Pestalotiopsis fici W106-1]ETS78761.1 hypothetical protein PFICI_08614 [Pestalotiopsis fici W106-1]
MADIQVLHAYRHLYRHGLRAIQFSKPARFVLRDRLRAAFREKGAQLDQAGVAKTLQFFEAAQGSRGLEHKVLKNLLFVAFHRYEGRGMKTTTIENFKIRPLNREFRATAYKHYDMTIAMLNKSMGLCLRG